MSFEDLYNQYYSLILNYINKKIQNYSDAEDLAMDTFLSIYKNFDSYDSRKANYNTWIFVIVNNKIKNYYRDKKENYDIDDNIIIDDDFSSQVVAAEYIVEMRQTLYEALKTINELQRKIIIYKFFYDKNATQIAEIIGIPSGSVRVQLSRGLEKVRKFFEKKGITWEEE